MIDCEILLVEDNPDDVELTLLAFEESNVCNEMTVVHDGQEALDYLFCTGKYAGMASKNLPAVILLDLKLPKVDGLGVLRKIREEPSTKCLPVVILTSSKDDEDIVRSYSLGANAYVRKPVDYSKFVEAAKTLGLFWLVLNQPPPRRRACQ